MKNYKFQLSPAQEKNLENVVLQNGKPLFPKEKETIFTGNKKTKEVIFESILFALSFGICLTFCTGIFILIINLLKY